MSDSFHWKPFLWCLLLMVVALLITVPLMFIGFGGTIPYSVHVFFPFAVLEQFLGFVTGSLILMNPVITLLVALLQYPTYGYFLGKASGTKELRKRIWIILALHLAGAVLAIVWSVIQLRHFMRPASEVVSMVSL